LENIRHDRLKTFIDFFMATLTLLYNDIKLALDEVAIEEINTQEDSYAKKTKEQLATIDELNATHISRLSDDQLRAYIKDLAIFYDECSARENGLRSSFKIKNYPSAMRWLSAIESSLTQIHATNLAEECLRQINLNNDYSAIRHEKFELFINFILSSLDMLCNDISYLNIEHLKLDKRPQ
jgi:hypothetical protein